MRTFRATAAVGLLLAIAGCGSDENVATRAPETEPTTSAASEPLPCVPGTEPFTGAAADAFGAERVMEAYCMLAGLAEEQGRTSLALLVPEQEARDVDALREVLTPAASSRWRAWTSRRAAADRSPVDGLTLHDVRRPPAGYQRADDGPYVYGTTVGPAVAELREDALALTFSVDTALVLEDKGDDAGRHSLLPVTRTGTYVLVPHDDGWLIDSWDASFEHGPVRLAVG